MTAQTTPALLLVLLSACSTFVDAEASPYDYCLPADDSSARSCYGATTCTPLHLAAMGDRAASALCTTTCLTAADCALRTGSAVVCQPLATTQLCLVVCDTDADCGSGTVCVDLSTDDGEELKRCAP